jgi:two-component system, LytTR family, sensor kinase
MRRFVTNRRFRAPGVVCWPQLMYSWKVLARSLAIATALAGFTYVRMIVQAGALPAHWLRDLLQAVVYPYSWAFQVPLLAPFFSRYPLPERPWRHTLYYCAAGLPAAIVPALAVHAVSYLAEPSRRMTYNIVLEWISGFIFFWMVAGIFQTVIARRNVRELEGRLAQAELQNLKSQLHPHFLFNTLHTISVLIREDAEAANRVLLKLSDLLRVSLDRSRADRIPLQQELEFLETYLSIEQTRFQERMRASIAADGEARAALIPTLLLQPLVENAVRHGIAPRAGGGSVCIAARRTGDVLELQVEDDGAGLGADFAERRARGCGLRNTESRLRAMYGAAGRLEVAPRDGGGVTAGIRLPYRRS